MQSDLQIHDTERNVLRHSRVANNVFMLSDELFKEKNIFEVDIYT